MTPSRRAANRFGMVNRQKETPGRFAPVRGLNKASISGALVVFTYALFMLVCQLIFSKKELKILRKVREKSEKSQRKYGFPLTIESDRCIYRADLAQVGTARCMRTKPPPSQGGFFYSSIISRSADDLPPASHMMPGRMISGAPILIPSAPSTSLAASRMI